MSDSYLSYSIQPAAAFDPRIGLNVSSDDPAATLAAELSALELSSVRASATTAPETSTLASLAARGISIDLVLAPGQSVAALVSVAQQIDAGTPGAVAFLEGPDLVADPGYTYTSPGSSTALTGDAAGDQAGADLVSAVGSSSGLGSVATVSYSTSVAATATAQASPTWLNINPGDVALSSPAAALSAAQDDATTDANVANPQYVVTNLGGSAPATLLDGLLDAQFRFGFSSTSSTSGSGTAATTTYTNVLPPTFLAAASTATTSPAALTSGGTLTAAGAAFVNLGALISSGTAGSSAGGSLSLGIDPYEQGVQYDENVEVFAGPGGSADILVWGDAEAPSTSGHGPSAIRFGTTQASVQVFDPTQGTTAVASFANLSELDITNSPDGPLVIRVSDTAASASGTAGTYAGVVVPPSTTGTSTTGTSTTGTSTTGTSTTGTSTSGTSTAGTTTSSGVTTTAGASGTTFVTPVNGASSVAASATGNDVINSRGTDTIDAGGGTDIVYASGPAATVTGGSGSLVFIAGAGAYAAGGGTGTDTLYGGSGANSLTGGAGANSILVAGTGNATLSGGAGSAAVMFGGPSTTSFLGSTAGSDTMVGGTGTNSFAMTQGDVAFGGPASTDTFYTGAGSALIVEGGGPTTVVLGTGTATMFAGGGADTYVVTSGLAAQAGIVGFKAGDRLSLSGFTGPQASSALSAAATGAFGTILALPDGTRITLYGTQLSASQITTA